MDAEEQKFSSEVDEVLNRMKLQYTSYEESGIYGELHNDDTFSCVTLTHAYQEDDGSWTPKVPPGQYTCVKGMHQLEGMKAPFETFEITNVIGHTNILFHIGNFDSDSEGCILLGLTRSGNMITDSKTTFEKFMDLMSDVDSFTLEVI